MQVQSFEPADKRDEVAARASEMDVAFELLMDCWCVDAVRENWTRKIA